MKFQLLGPVTAFSGGRRVELGPAKQRCVLAALLLDAGHVVSTEQLIDRVWGENPPRTVRGTLYSYLTHIRAVLKESQPPGAPPALLRHTGGYELHVSVDDIDLHVFRRTLTEARTAEDERAAELLNQVLEKWHDEALSDLTGLWVEATRTRLEDERQLALRQLHDIRLRQGRAEQLLPTLRDLAARRPLDERLAGQLITALCQAGRQGEALQCYESVRKTLDAELGIAPGPELQALHRRILTADLALQPALVAQVPAAAWPVPRQLPACPALFTGREKELTALDETLAQSFSHSEALKAVAISGMAGVGKTWLALRWAHQRADRFPDGQLYVDLRGFTPGQEPLSSADVLRGLLEALGVPSSAIPVSPESQAGLYRSLMAGKRMLMVLDNARDSAQVTPLLPGTSACTVVITSRHRLSGLIAAHGARSIPLTTLSDDDARHLLAAHLGRRAVDLEPDAVRVFLDRCAGLPLALGILGTRGSFNQGLPLAMIAQEVNEATTRLDALEPGELSSGLRAVFATSCARLSEAAATLFFLLGLAPQTEFSLFAAARLTDAGLPGARSLLHQLESAHLLQQHRPGRYRMHDLIRLYAAERGRRTLPEDTVTAALSRLVDGYLVSAHAADLLLTPSRQPITIPVETASDAVDHLPDAASAMSWFSAEHSTLLALQEDALKRHWHERAWQLAWLTEIFHVKNGLHRENLAAWQTAMTAARHIGDADITAQTHRCLGRAHMVSGNIDDALSHLSQALTFLEEKGDTLGMAFTHHALGWSFARKQDEKRALDHARRSLRLFQVIGSPVWVAQRLNAVGWYLAQQGLYRRARVRCEQSLRLFEQEDQRIESAAALDSLGYVAARTGAHQEAIDLYARARAIYEEGGDRYEEANTLDRLGSAYLDSGRAEEAAAAWMSAHDLYKAQCRFGEADRMKARLAELRGDRTGPGVE